LLGSLQHAPIPISGEKEGNKMEAETSPMCKMNWWHS